MNFDYVNEGRSIAKELFSLGLEDWQQRIEEVIDFGSTGTEILMGVRWNLSELIKSDTKLPPLIDQRLKDYILSANKILGD